jgi:hypothetical protein
MEIIIKKEEMHMDKFVPKEKLSKKAKRKLAKAQRQTWGGINPVTRKPKNPKAYVREKPRYESDDDTGVFHSIRIDAPSSLLL